MRGDKFMTSTYRMSYKCKNCGKKLHPVVRVFDKLGFKMVHMYIDPHSTACVRLLWVCDDCPGYVTYSEIENRACDLDGHKCWNYNTRPQYLHKR